MPFCPTERFSRDSKNICYRAFHRFGHAKFPDDGSILGSSQFSKLLQLPPKILLDLKNNHLDSLVKIGDTLCTIIKTLKIYLGSISSLFYEQLFCQFPFTKKMQHKM